MTDREIVKCQLCGRAYERAVYAFNINKRKMAAKKKAKSEAAATTGDADIPMAHAAVLEIDNPEESAKEDQGLIATAEANTVV